MPPIAFLRRPYAATNIATAAVTGIATGGLNLRGPDALTAGPAVAASGVGILTGSYKYQIAAYTALGETGFSPLSSQLDLSSQKGAVTLPVSSDSRVLGWNIFRSKIGDMSRTYLAGTVSNGVTSFVDNIADGSLGKDSHYLQTTTGYACPPILCNGVNAFHLQGLNLAIGESAGTEFQKPANQSVDTLYSLAIGSNSVNAYFTGGGFVLGIGGGTLQYLTHGAQITAVGHKAGQLSDWTIGCAYFGAFAGQNNQRYNNTLIGNNSCAANTTGERIAALGSDTVSGNFSDAVLLGHAATATKAEQMVATVKQFEMTLGTGETSVVLRSANGTRYKLTVSNAGALVIGAA